MSKELDNLRNFRTKLELARASAVLCQREVDKAELDLQKICVHANKTTNSIPYYGTETICDDCDKTL